MEYCVAMKRIPWDWLILSSTAVVLMGIAYYYDFAGMRETVHVFLGK